MTKSTTKIFYGLLILSVLLILSMALPVFGKDALDRLQIHNASVKKPISEESPVFLTKFLLPETSKSNQFSQIGSFSDLLISESVSPATFTQRNSTITRLTDSRTVVGWTDDRNGNQMIFIQIFDSDGVRSGSNILVIGRDDRNDVSNPQLVSDGAGGFYLGWRDDATGSIYVSKFNGELNKQAEFRISNPVLGYAGLYDLALYPGGKLAAVWEQYSIKNSINFRIFSNEGTPLTQNIAINDDDGTATYWAPSIAVETSGNLVVTWEDYRNGDADIYMQFVNSDGSLYGSNQRIIDFDYIAEEQYLPEIAYSATDGYIISWLDLRTGSQRVFLQRITRADGLIGDNVNISDNAGETADWYISMAVNSSGNLAVAWSSVDGTDKALMQKFSSDVTPDGPIITVSDFDNGNSWETSLEFDNADNLYCSWSDSRRGNWDILLKQYDSNGTPLGDDDIIVNDDTEGAHSTQPSIGLMTNIGYLYGILYADTRNDAGDIYFRYISTDGQLYGNEAKVNSDNIPARQKDPYLRRHFEFGNESAAAVWVDERAINGVVGQRIFLRGFRDPADFIYNEMIVSDSFSLSPKSSPKFASTDLGSEAVAWIDYESGDGQIYSRIFNQYNSPTYWTEIKQISQAGVETDNDFVNLMAYFNGNHNDEKFTIAWLSRGVENGPSVIFAQCDNSNNVVNKFSFTSDQADIEIKEISAAENLSGDMYLLWSGQGNGICFLYLTVFDRSGNIINPTYEITGGIGGIKEGIDIGVDINNGVVAATWVDTRNSRDEVFYQLFYPDITPYETNSPVSETEQRYMMSPSILMDSRNNAAVIAWVDPRTDGHNVYMTQIDYGTTDINNTDPGTLPTGYSLEQNYPNPFNPTTSIQFALPSKSHVKLEVYNLLGRKIATIADNIFESGTHTVNWDGKNNSGEQSASGIYFYKIKADQFDQTRKMILLK